MGDNTGIKVTMIIFIMLSISLGVALYLVAKDQDTFKQQALAAKQNADASDAALRNLQSQMENVKQLIGHEMETIGEDPATTDKNSVLGAMNDDIKTYGGQIAMNTYSKTIVELRNQLNNVVSERDQLLKEQENARTKLLGTQDQYQQQVTQHQRKRDETSKELVSISQKFESEVKELSNERDTINSQLSKTKTELDLEREKFVNFEKQKKEEIKGLIKINDILREDLDEIREVSFEKPDGLIRWVDNATGLCWVNLGTEDNLPKQLTFSVYPAVNRGVARGDTGIKGSIEVTRVLGPHLSEARILSLTDLDNPISPEDVVYTPLWQQGRIEKFSLVGLMDLDNDEVPDRDILHDVILSAGAVIDNEVDDDGNRTGEMITVDTKFLVIGSIPDPAGLPPESKELEKINRMIKHRTDMVNEARLSSVRVVNLNDFLSYIGYTPKQRLFIPGRDGNKYKLKAGSKSASTNEPIFNKSAAGNVSKIFTDRKNTKQDSSSGNVSGGYKN